MNTEDEKILVSRCLEGDEAAWSELYRTFYPQIRFVVGWKRWGFSKNEVEDGIQEVFTELIRSLPNFRCESRLSTFVDRLARNRCISHLRKKSALKRPKETFSVELEEGKGEEGMTRHHVALRYYRQMSYQEICAVLELPLGTVCSRLKRCLSKLKSSIYQVGGL